MTKDQIDNKVKSIKETRKNLIQPIEFFDPNVKDRK